ncbi:hypothetical protein Rhopal_001650-T1 [Rhodotorula paludigena]|uniref:Uncharacterized protein n=1 Tax=Rhodotorula paludigena TaxID=86838 RepID=A0AAV5GHF5_9BASI|nr:hypothetical protein Rhopal_001650-T1 [Rhodotorula paludigena]
MGQLMPFRDDVPKQEVYERLIDAFRLWCDDLQIWRGESIGLYAEEDPYPEFVKFVNKAAPNLPSWWNASHKAAVLSLCRTHSWANIAYAVEKSDINEHYGAGFAMWLRMWTAEVTGVSLTG